MDYNLDICTSACTQDRVGPREDSVRQLYDDYVTSITNRITDYEGNVSANVARLQALEKKMEILPDTVIIFESVRKCLTSIIL